MRATSKNTKSAAKIIQEHYCLNRKVTDVEIEAEIANLRRKDGKGTLDNFDEILFSSLHIHGHIS